MQRLAFYIVYPLLKLISILPFPLLYFISDIVFVLVYTLFGYRKKVVKANLKLAFPEKTEQERKKIERRFYKHLCDLIFEAIKSMHISEENLKKRFQFENIETISAFEKQNKNIVLMLSHYGNWEWVFIMQSFIESKGYGIYKRLKNKHFDKLVKEIRAKFNTELITTKETIEILTESKRNNELSISGFISDQSPKPQKAFHWNEFMGVYVPVHTGAELIAKRFDSPVVFAAIDKVKRGYYTCTFKTIAVNSSEYEDYEITDEFLKLTEEQIRKKPELYLWTHKRWKHRKKRD
ncbi:MAG: lysophospholipid acyltransferase family protein [Psychroflexus sp.]|nr:lysophospholipid acyltransferase family protein [Psychroflexus sp.]MDN6310969.1 lysophospholipid acyltransferase family protein [Psychroflexus sp.]